MISDLRDGFDASGIYLVKNVSRGTASGGAPFLSITLQDKTGTIEAKKWSATPQEIELVQTGLVVKVVADCLLYKEKLQLKVYSIEEADMNNTNGLENLLLESPIALEDLLVSYKYFMNSIQNEDCKKILNSIFDKYYEKFIVYPAAVRNHHEFYHGLLYHTIGMCKLAEQVAKLYNDVDHDLLISGCLLHDLGKVIELSGPVCPQYTIEGDLLGHISIGMSIIRETAHELNIQSEVPLLLEHMILAHHGKMEYGSPITPRTREALLLSMIDDLDAKMMVLDKAYKDVEPGDLTERIFAIDNTAFYKHKKLD